jgi:hypothetical protein
MLPIGPSGGVDPATNVVRLALPVTMVEDARSAIWQCTASRGSSSWSSGRHRPRPPGGELSVELEGNPYLNPYED